MNLLIVDDDLHVIQAIQRNIPWEKLEIEHVYYVLGVSAARKMFSEHTIDIVVCDIEMPRETGMDLVDWIRAEGHRVQVIFLTSYAKFEYARKAIELGSLEYILKPVDYDLLEQAIRKAAKTAEKERENERLVRNRQYWEQNRQKVADHFWHQIIKGNDSAKSELLDSFISECGMMYVREMIFLPVVLQTERYDKEKFRFVEQCLKKICETFSEKKETTVISYEAGCSISGNMGISVLKAYLNTENTILNSAICHIRKNLPVYMKQQGLRAFAGIGMWSVIDLVSDDIEQIYSMMLDSPRNQEDVLSLEAYQPSDIPRILLDTKKWIGLLREGRPETLKREVRDLLRYMEQRNQISSRNLQQFGMDFTQMIYAYLDSVNIYAHMLFDNKESSRMYGQAALSVDNMLKYVGHLLMKTANDSGGADKKQGVEDTIKEYIDKNFQHNLTRDELSRLVFLNPDYLSRIFKKKFGLSIGSYITSRRMEEAKKLLVSTNIPISVIAVQTGYDNFAYFTKVFKEKMGMSPNEYRKQYKQQERDRV